MLFESFNPSFDGNPKVVMIQSGDPVPASKVSILLLMEIPKW